MSDWRKTKAQRVEFLLTRNPEYAEVVRRWNDERLIGAIPATGVTTYRSATTSLTEKEKAVERLVEERQAELRSMSLQDLAEEYAKEYAAYEAEERARKKRVKQLKDIYERIDTDYAVKQYLWTVREAISFSLGKDPEKWNDLTKDYENLERLVREAISLGKLSTTPDNQVKPIDFITWAELNEIDMPDGLASKVRQWDQQRNQDNDDQETETITQANAQEENEPPWLLEPAAGGKWRCGLEGQTKLIKGTQGLTDLRYAVRRRGVDCDPLEYYTSADSDTDGVPQRDSAPDALDARAMADIKGAIEDFESRLEVAEKNGDLETVQDTNEKLEKARKYLLENTRPDGQSRKIYKGDAPAKLINQMRGRRDTVVRNLRDVGLNDMADHIKDHYVFQTLSFSYTGSSLKV